MADRIDRGQFNRVFVSATYRTDAHAELQSIIDATLRRALQSKVFLAAGVMLSLAH